MNEMSLPSRHRIQNSSPGGRKLHTILSFTSGWGRNIFVSFKPPRPGNEPRTLAWKAAVLTTTPGPPPTHRSGRKKWQLKALRATLCEYI